MTQIITHPTYDVLHHACLHLITQIKQAKITPDCILGLARGGLLSSVVMSHLFDCPLIVANYSSKSGAGDNKNHNNVLPTITQNCIVVVDDIADSGRTLQEIFTHYTLQKKVVYTAVLYYKEQLHGFKPDFNWQIIPTNAPWIVFPFEVESGNIKDE